MEKVSTSSDSPHGVKPTLPDPKTLKSAGEIKNPFLEAGILHTERLYGLLESSINCRLERLCKSTLQACPETNTIQRGTNKAHESRKEKENGVIIIKYCLGQKAQSGG